MKDQLLVHAIITKNYDLFADVVLQGQSLCFSILETQETLLEFAYRLKKGRHRIFTKIKHIYSIECYYMNELDIAICWEDHSFTIDDASKYILDAVKTVMAPPKPKNKPPITKDDLIIKIANKNDNTVAEHLYYDNGIIRCNYENYDTMLKRKYGMDTNALAKYFDRYNDIITLLEA